MAVLAPAAGSELLPYAGWLGWARTVDQGRL